jgi:LacI family transcriptional regulator
MPIKEAGPTSLRDIALAAGVSIATVSRALHDHPDISAQTRSLIKALADEMNYQPNMLAQSLVNRSTHTIGVIIPNLNTTFFSSMLSGIQQVCARSGYRVVICQSDEDHNTEMANIQALMNNMIDGLLICHTLHTDTFEHLRMQMNKRIPIVQFYRVAEDLPISRIHADDETGADTVTDHLIDRGCKRIALLLGPKNLSITQKRLKGYLQALNRHGIPLDRKLLAHIDFSQEKVIRTVDNWLKLTPAIDAIFSISDKCAVQIIGHLKKKKIKIPEQIRVVGFGNEYTGEIVEPQLTTYDVRTREIGEEAAGMILEKLISGDKDVIDKRIAGKLIIRQSS